MSIARDFLRSARKMGIGINEARTSGFIGETSDGFFAVKIDGLPKISSFRDRAEYRTQIEDFKKKAKKGYADTKRKSYTTGVRKFIREHGANQYFCFNPMRSGEKDDSLEVYYIADEAE